MRYDFGKYAAEIESGLRADREAREAREKENAPEAPEAREEETPEREKTPERPALAAISARELQEKELPPIRELVPGLIVQGLTVLGAPPKFGKSWLMLELCLAAAGGAPFLGYPTKKTGCLYLALEDSQRRLKDRMSRLLRGSPAPEGFYSSTEALTTDTGLLPQLERFLEERPETGLVVIDTLQRVRGSTFGRDGSYAADYRELGVLKAFADRRRLALILVHHLRKMGDDTDPFNRLSGTAAIAGAADAMIILSKDKRSADITRLSATGRDIGELELELRFRKDGCSWVNLGTAEALAAQRAAEEYEASPIVRTVRKLLEQSAAREWTGTATQLMEAGQYVTGRYLAPSIRKLSQALGELDGPLLENDGILHLAANNGNAGKRHTYRYAGEPRFREPEDQQEFPG